MVAPADYKERRYLNLIWIKNEWFKSNLIKNECNLPGQVGVFYLSHEVFPRTRNSIAVDNILEEKKFNPDRYKYVDQTTLNSFNDLDRDQISGNEFFLLWTNWMILFTGHCIKKSLIWQIAAWALKKSKGAFSVMFLNFWGVFLKKNTFSKQSINFPMNFLWEARPTKGICPRSLYVFKDNLIEVHVSNCSADKAFEPELK